MASIPISTFDFSTTLLPAGSTWDAASLIVPPTHAVQVENLPAEPSGLSMALVGMGIFGAYAGLGWRRRDVPAATIGKTPTVGRQDVAEKSRREAA